MSSRAAVLASGTGTNLQAMLDDRQVAPHLVLVVSDRPTAGALDRGRGGGVETACLQPAHYDSRGAFDAALAALLKEHAIDCVLLAGYMRILGPEMVRPFAGRILNVHPSLLPAFPGAHAVRDALEWGVKVTGVTVHFVDEEVDHGPIVTQEPVLVLPGDDEESLHGRIRSLEHRLYPHAARLLLEGKLKIEGRHVHILDEDVEGD